MSDRRSITSRENAKKSTGPKTAAGKAASALNGMKFGIYSEMTIVEGESEADFLAFTKRMRADLAPVGEVELTLVDRIISTAWRLRRVVGCEALIFENEENWHNVFGGYAGDRILRLGRHEASLERSLHRNMHELQRRQAERQGEKVDPPQVLDVLVDAGDATLPEPATRALGIGSFRQNGPEAVAKINGTHALSESP